MEMLSVSVCVCVSVCLFCYLAGEGPGTRPFCLRVLDSTVFVGVKHSPCDKGKTKTQNVAGQLQHNSEYSYCVFNRV